MNEKQLIKNSLNLIFPVHQGFLIDFRVKLADIML